MNDFDRTQELNVDAMVKTIPVVCSWCNKIYHMKQWTVDFGKQTGVSHGMCPECEKEQLKQFEKFVAKKDQNNGNGRKEE